MSDRGEAAGGRGASFCFVRHSERHSASAAAAAGLVCRSFTIPLGGPLMSRAYNVVDADGHILEPLDLWTNYMDPAFRDRAPRLIKAENGKERLVMDEHVVGTSQRGIGSIGGGVRPRGGGGTAHTRNKSRRPARFSRCQVAD